MNVPYVCPRTGGPLNAWYSPEGHLTYPLLDGIPVLVPDPVMYLGRHAIRRAQDADPAALGLPDAITPHLPPQLFAAPGGFGQWLASIGDGTADAVAATQAARHAPRGPALDVGCGVGAMTRRMVAAGRPTWAFDMSADAVLLARGLLCGALTSTTIPTHKGGLRRVKVPFKPIVSGLEFCIADATSPPFPDGSFAWIHLGDVLDSLRENLVEALVRSAGLLVPGGVMTVTTAYGYVLGAEEEAPPPDEEMLEALEGLGLQVVEQQDRVPSIVREYDRSFRVRFMHTVAARKRA